MKIDNTASVLHISPKTICFLQWIDRWETKILDNSVIILKYENLFIIITETLALKQNISAQIFKGDS